MQAWCEFAQHNNKYLAENYAMAHLQAWQREYFIPVRQSSYFVPFRHFTHRRVKAQTKMLSRGAWGLQDLARWRKCKRGACLALGYFGSLTNSNEHKFAFILKVYCKNKLRWVFIALKKIRSAFTVFYFSFKPAKFLSAMISYYRLFVKILMYGGWDCLLLGSNGWTFVLANYPHFSPSPSLSISSPLFPPSLSPSPSLSSLHLLPSVPTITSLYPISNLCFKVYCVGGETE